MTGARGHAPVRSRRQSGRRQTGFSLIELMIALSIGLFLVAGLGMILFGVRDTYKAQDGLLRMQEGQRYLLTSLNNSVQTAGYFINPASDSILNALPATPSNPNPDGSSFVAGQGIVGTTGSSSDTLNTRYQSANNDAMNCLGRTNPSQVPVVWINSYAVNANSELVCNVTTIDATGAVSSGDVVLVDKIASMKILYGVGANGDGQTSRYVRSNQVTAPITWQDVVSVKVTLVQIDQVNVTPSMPNPQELVHVINLLNNSGKRPGSP